MIDDLRDLYQEVILDHGKNPRNFGKLDPADGHARGHNPLCGDQLEIFVGLDPDGTIREVTFEGKGCAISVASASMMTELVKGKTVEQARELFHRFHEMCAGDEDIVPAAPDDEDMEKLMVLSGVRQFPVRVKCATLAWHTLQAAMEGKEQASTE